MPTDAEILDWLERNHTLHRTVEAAYVVDGYEVTIRHDDKQVAGPWYGKTLRDAYAAAVAAYTPTTGEASWDEQAQPRTAWRCGICGRVTIALRKPSACTQCPGGANAYTVFVQF